MRPVGGDAASAASHAPRSRKSSLTDNHAPNVTSGPPTTFFMATEDEILASSSQGGISESRPGNPPARRCSIVDGRQTGVSRPPDTIAGARRPSISEARRSSVARPSDSVYGVQSLEDALGEAFRDKSKNEPQAESSNGGLAALLGLKRRKTLTNPEGIDKTGVSDQLRDGADDSSRHSPPRDTHAHDLGSHHTRRSSRSATISQPLTPLQLESPMPDSAMPSTPKSGSFRSLHLSDEDEGTEDGASQAIASSGEEDDEEHDHSKEADMSGSVMPELVMPSLSMPSRRPFTARGERMGRLKVCIAGPSGVGKTSLIRAIVQQCQDIVHIDPISTNSPHLQSAKPSRTRSRGKKQEKNGTLHITEIHASTKAYPAWWSEMEESRVLRRRKSMGETVLERNICFIDTPGNSPTWTEEHVVRYVEGLMHRNASVTAMNDSELLNVLSGSGGVQVDVVIYVVPHEWTHDEHITHLGRLASLTNVIPVISKSDLLSDEDICLLKRKLVKDLQDNGHRTFSFARSTDEPLRAIAGPENSEHRSPLFRAGPPFAVSCLPGSNDHEMDASLLMSPSYRPPLTTSDLEDLVSQLFDPENIAYLRHSAVRKFIAWKRQKMGEAVAAGGAVSGGDSLIMGSPTSIGIREQIALARRTHSSPSPSQGLVHRGRDHHHQRPVSPTSTTSPFNMSSTAIIGTGLPDFTRARLRDHIFREERLAEVQLAKWASDLQRSLRSERETFERVARGERAKWLLERIGEEVAQGNIGALDERERSGSQLSEWALARHDGKRGRSAGAEAGMDMDMELPPWARGARYSYEEDARDPLGLCKLGDGVCRVGEVVVRVLGGGVLVGAVWLAVARAWGWEGRMGWGWWGGQ